MSFGGCQIAVLTRFGVGVIQRMLTGHGVRIVNVGQAGDESAEAELLGYMLATLTRFAWSPNGEHSAITKRLHAAVSAETDCGVAG